MLGTKNTLRLLAVAVLFIWTAAFSILGFNRSFQTAEANAPSHITLTWSDDPRTTQTITWKTDVKTVDGQVRYWLLTSSQQAVVKNASAQVEQIDSNWGRFNLHTAKLTGLTPGEPYAYQVGADADWSEQYVFVAAPAKSIRYRFLVFGDSQSVNYNTWRTTLDQAYLANRGAAFFINMGDLVDRGQEYGEWNGWFNAAHGVLENIPCMPLVGNHETYAIGGGFSMPTLFTDQFKLPLNGPDGLKGQVYSFDYGAAHFVMLDTQIGEEGRFAPDMLEKQKAWLAADLASSSQKWKLVFMHRALYNNKSAANAAIQKAFAPILDQYHANVVFTAHDHVYARTYPLAHDAVVDNAQAGTTYIATGRSGSKTYPDSIDREWNNFFYNPLDEPNYLTVDVDEQVLTVRAYRQSGSLIDEYRIERGLP